VNELRSKGIVPIIPTPFTAQQAGRMAGGAAIGVLEAGGCSFEDVVKCTCHLANINDFDRFNRVYSEFSKNVLPARTTVQSALWGGIKVEIDAIARVKA